MLICAKIFLSSSSCPCSNDSGACGQNYSFYNDGNTPSQNGYVSFAKNFIDDGWVYDFSMTSPKFCESFRVDKTQNYNKTGGDFLVSHYISGSAVSFTLTVYAPCNNGNGTRSFYKFSGTVSDKACNSVRFIGSSIYESGQVGC